MVAPVRIGLGLIATKSIRAGETITRLEGRVVHHSILWRRQGTKFSANCIRYGPETYLDPRDGFGAYLNHSCEPSAGLRKVNNRLFLFAAKRIDSGAEVTIDYATTIGDDDIWKMKCKCGSTQCRKTIRNLGSLPIELKRSYVKRGLVPMYIIRTLVERIVVCGTVALMSILAASRAEGQTSIDAQTASKMIEGCVAHSKAKGQSHGIAIYDSGGHPVSLLRMDGNPAGVMEFSMRKAEAAAYWQFSTAQMETSAKATPGFANAPHVVTVAGGVPVFSADGRTFIGAVGVSGEAPQDANACAEAAVKAAGLSLSRKRAN